jgi:hypothetical protein
MPWTDYAKEPDDAIHDWLKSLYTPYRNALVDPTVMPEETKILWDTPWAGQLATSFMVCEDQTDHLNRGLGAHNIDFFGLFYAKVTQRWIRAGKPTAISAIREFLIRKLHEASGNVPSVLKTEAGIYEMIPANSRLYQWPPDNAQADFWVLEVRVRTAVHNSIV